MNAALLRNLSPEELIQHIRTDLNATDVQRALCDHLEDALEEIDELTDQAEIEKLEDEIAKQDERIQELESEVDKKESEIEDLTDELDELKRQAA